MISCGRFVLLLGLLAAEEIATSSEHLADETVYVDPGLGPVFPRVVREAATRLESSPCRLLLEDFRNGSTDLPLAESLSAMGLSAAEFLRSIRFRSGQGDARCSDRRLAAYTSPGSRAVVVCPVTGLGFRARDGRSTVTIVLHEALHSLGLRENPPSSEEITAAVERRCGR